MFKNVNILMIILSVIVLVFFLSGCSSVVSNSADELTLNSWQTTFDNGNKVRLVFDGDYATLTLSVKDFDTTTISGLCECDDNSIIIYDKMSGIAYPFSYVVHFDKVDVTYGKNTVSLYKDDK